MPIPSSRCPLLFAAYLPYTTVHLAVVNACNLLTFKARGRWTTVQGPAMETLNLFLANTMAR